MMNRRHFIWAICGVILPAIIMSKGAAMNIFKNDFEQRWEELFKDVRKLNEYTTTHPVELSKVKISEQNIDGAIFIGAQFTGVKWEATRGQKSKFTKIVFRDCEFISSNFDESIFVDVEFVDCKFLDSTLSGSTMTGVRFVNCTMEETKLTGLDGTELVIEGGEYKVRTSFSFSGIPFKFKNASFSGVNFMGMVDSCPLSIEGGLLSEVDFSKSHFSTVTLRRVKQGEGGIKFNGITAKDILLEDVDLDGIGFMNATADTAIIRNSQIFAIGFSGGGVGKIYFSNSTIRYFDIAESMMPHVEFTKCKLYEPMLYDGLIEEFAIRESTITDMKGKNFKADIVLWDNVTLDGKIDLTNAQVKDFRPTRLKRGPRLNLITTGSNMKF
jgi:uncharacterized protein YjbI with pentapeptide repeats